MLGGKKAIVTEKLQINQIVNEPLEIQRDETIGQIMHPGKNNPWKCCKCEAQFNTNALLVNHMRRSHQVKTFEYECDGVWEKSGQF